MAEEKILLTYKVVYIDANTHLTDKKRDLLKHYSLAAYQILGHELARMQEEACREMANRGLTLTHVVPVQTSVHFGMFHGPASWTIGAWLYFAGTSKLGLKGV